MRSITDEREPDGCAVKDCENQRKYDACENLLRGTFV